MSVHGRTAAIAGIPDRALPEWHALSDALDELGPAPCEDGPPEAWWERDGHDLARDVCGHCRVARECLAYAVAAGERDGVWGGLTGDERRAVPAP